MQSKNASCRMISTEILISMTGIWLGKYHPTKKLTELHGFRDKAKELTKKPNYLTVPAAIRELEKIEMTRHLDKIYRLDHAVTKTQKVILSAFGIDTGYVQYKAKDISETLKGET